MPYRVNTKDIASVSTMSVAERARHLVKRVADQEEIWGLRAVDGWALSRAPGGAHALPVWPHPKYAKLCATGPWAGCEPAKIDLPRFVERWIPRLAKEKRVISVFPTPKSAGRIVRPARFETALKGERASH